MDHSIGVFTLSYGFYRMFLCYAIVVVVCKLKLDDVFSPLKG